jgi:hypothetical protein
MAIEYFSTERADYILHLGDHLESEYANTFWGADALVVETGANKARLVRDPSGFEAFVKEFPQFEFPTKLCREEGKPIYMTDCNVTTSGKARSVPSLFSDTCPLLPFTHFLKIYSSDDVPYFDFHDHWMIKSIKGLYTGFSYVMQEPLVEGRNAVNARNIEEFVVPHVCEKSGKDHPVVGLFFGASHVGLENDLKSKRRRNFTIWNLRNLNLSKYAGLDREELGTVCEVQHNGTEWKITEHSTGLFD